ncbi:MAG: T9SS type A sorting domain-containing protein, partial [Flavobacteriales bacterium]|nr:T9SS type A sorting domain-containing protein [Flavobacteriales bacterium]
TYFLPISAKVEITIYNLQGEKIETIIEEKMLKGKHHFYYNTNTLNGGSYFCKFKTERFSSTQRIVVVK